MHFSRPAVIDGKSLAPGTYYVHTPAAGEAGPVLIVNAASGSEIAVAAVRSSHLGSRPQAILAREGREDRLKAIRTGSQTFEFTAGELAKAE